MRELPVPEPLPGHVLIRVAYAGVNFAEVYQRLGVLGTTGALTVPGLETAGHVAGLGDGVTGLELGEPVAALTHPRAGASGGYAEYATAPATLVYSLRAMGPDPDLRSAAAIPCMLTTACALLAITHFGDGETLLVHAAAGGVGSVAAQIARGLGAGATIGTVGRAEKIVVASSYGYDHVFTRDAFAAPVSELVGERGVDVALDSVAGPARAQSLELLAPLGRLAVFGNAGREPDITVAPGQLWLDSRAIVGYNIGELAMQCPEVVRRHALEAVQLLAEGRVLVDVADVVPLAGAGEVHRALETGATNGKFVLAVAE